VRELQFLGPGRLDWVEAEEPRLQTGADALVRPVAVATCDLDTVALAGGAPLTGPFPFGHEFVADVVAVSDDVRSVGAGDRVIVPFQISCGECDRCRRGQTGSCRTAGAGASYGLGALGGLEWGGALSDLVRVPYADAMTVPLPSGIPARSVASMGDNIPDGWRTVAPGLERWPGAPVLVVGGGAVGIPFYAIAIARALGAERVDYLDDDPARLARAERVGAEAVEGPYPRRAGRFPITVDASGDPAGLRCALRSTDAGGMCTSIAIYWDEVALPLLEMYTRGVTFVTARVDARAVIPSALELVAQDRFHPELVTETVAPWGDAPAVLADHRAKTVIVRDDA
jgi:alcohol dehydrogenase